MRNGSTSSPAAAFVDTNVLVYAYDASDAFKHERAIEVLDRLERRSAGAISTQVLGEFFTIATRRIPMPLGVAEAERSVIRYARAWTVYEPTCTAVLEAVRAVREHTLSYWDGLIWATAKLNEVPTVLSEDFSDGLLLEGVRFLNPFRESFDVASLA